MFFQVVFLNTCTAVSLYFVSVNIINIIQTFCLNIFLFQMSWGEIILLQQNLFRQLKKKSFISSIKIQLTFSSLIIVLISAVTNKQTNKEKILNKYTKIQIAFCHQTHWFKKVHSHFYLTKLHMFYIQDRQRLCARVSKAGIVFFISLVQWQIN